MKTIIYFATALVLFLAQAPSSKEWHGLSPLASTRADVERVLGKAEVNHRDQVWIFYLSDIVVTFNFSANPNCREKLSYPSWNVPMGTLTSIGIDLKQPVPLANFTRDLTQFKKVPGDFDLPDHFYLFNENDGFSIEVGRNYVKGYIYEPSFKQKALRCPAIN